MAGVKLLRPILVLALGIAGCAAAAPAPVAAPTVVLPPPIPTVSPAPPGTAAVTTVDLPKAAEWTALQVVFAVQVRANGDVFVDGVAVHADAELLALARQAIQRVPDLRAVIQADQAATHGRVIHVLDLLKQGGITKLAFAVSAPH